uniref:Uncharacterized protein n=1 Tax=Sphaerodactylus townsendi TaxID=933632 RepID=A0ACB8EAB2_9SAUR
MSKRRWLNGDQTPTPGQRGSTWAVTLKPEVQTGIPCYANLAAPFVAKLPPRLARVPCICCEKGGRAEVGFGGWGGELLLSQTKLGLMWKEAASNCRGGQHPGQKLVPLENVEEGGSWLVFG